MARRGSQEVERLYREAEGAFRHWEVAKDLVDELKKITRVAGKALDRAPHKTILVLDATNGQNALSQAKEFREAVDVDGIVMTKLDGTAKGGVIIGICDEMRVPVHYIGIGHYFDFAITAAGVGAAKPDPRIFRAAVDAAGVRPDQIVHVGDDPVRDVLAAGELGLRTVWVNMDDAEWPGGLGADRVVSHLGELWSVLRAWTGRPA